MIEQLGALGVTEADVLAYAWLTFAAAIGAGAGWYFLRESPALLRLAASLSVGALLGVSTLAWRPSAVDAELDTPLPERARASGYASSDACRACHPGEHASWHRSFHRTMTQVATAAAVRAPFVGQVLSERGRHFQLARRGEAFYVREVADPAPRELDEAFFAGARRVVMTTGSHHMQAYWYESRDGQLEQLQFVYLLRDQRWLANSDSFLEPPAADDAPLTRYTWSSSCVTCHSTGGPWDARAGHADATPEDQLVRAEERGRVRAALAVLEPRERALVEGYYLEGRLLDEIGAELGITKSWASRICSRALGKLRGVLDGA